MNRRILLVGRDFVTKERFIGAFLASPEIGVASFKFYPDFEKFWRKNKADLVVVMGVEESDSELVSMVLRIKERMPSQKVLLMRDQESVSDLLPTDLEGVWSFTTTSLVEILVVSQRIMNNDMGEFRRYKRFYTSSEASFSVTGLRKGQKCFLRDISRSGARVVLEGSCHARRGDTIKLGLLKKKNIDAEVIWTKHDTLGMCITGVRFENLQPISLAANA